jgi:hypothetical protein
MVNTSERPREHSAEAMPCKVCEKTALAFGNGKVLGRHLVQYFRCDHCGFIQTEQPYWLEEAYCEAITKTDIGLVGRNVSLAGLVKLIIAGMFDSQAKFLDYGGGYGMFARLMRDAGLDFYLYDQYCQNLFAKGFALEGPENESFELVTAFEVFEHLVDPMRDIERMRQFSPSILFTTTLVPTPAPLPGEWWYYGLEHGQHVALYSYETLSFIAEHFGVSLVSDRKCFHLLTPKPVPRWLFKALLNRWSRQLVKGLLNRKLAGRSLLAADYEKLGGRAQS